MTNVTTMTTKYTSKISNTTPGMKTIRCVIPHQIATQLSVVAGDSLKWIINDDGTVSVEKLEL